MKSIKTHRIVDSACQSGLLQRANQSLHFVNLILWLEQYAVCIHGFDDDRLQEFMNCGVLDVKQVLYLYKMSYSILSPFVLKVKSSENYWSWGGGVSLDDSLPSDSRT